MPIWHGEMVTKTRRWRPRGRRQDEVDDAEIGPIERIEQDVVVAYVAAGLDLEDELICEECAQTVFDECAAYFFPRGG